MVIFYLLRHGRRVSQSEDTSLSDIGIKQAQLTAKHFQNQTISAIYSSPLKRAWQTAKIISAVLKIPICTDDRLTERLNWGDRKGESYDEFLNEWNKTSIDRNYKPPLGNSSYETGNRMKSVLDEVSDTDCAILIVTHGGAISDFLRNVFPEDKLPFRVDSSLNIKYIEILECSITEVQKTNDKYILKKVNDISHLPIPIV